MRVAWRLAASATVGLAATAFVVGTTPAAATPVPPDDTSGTAFLRATSEQAAAEWFAANVPGGVTQVACAHPPADEGGVQFLCYAVDAAGAVVVARVTVDDYGTPELAAVAAGAATATTVAVVDSATTAVYTGTGSQTVPVDPVPSLMLAAITVSGSGPVTVQPVHASAPVGPPIVGTAPLQGRYLIGSAGPFSSLAVTAAATGRSASSGRRARSPSVPASRRAGCSPTSCRTPRRCRPRSCSTPPRRRPSR